MEGNRQFTLTEARMNRRWGGEGRGDHGEAIGERGNAFSRWRARTAAAMLGQQWRAAAVNTVLRAEKEEGKVNGETQREWRGVAFIWSSSTRHGDLDRACTPCGETL